jgi:hypothetical protein
MCSPVVSAPVHGSPSGAAVRTQNGQNMPKKQAAHIAKLIFAIHHFID